jgi:hypothetical protein
LLTLKTIFMRFIFIFFLGFILQANAQTQTTVIDYQSWSGASGCNIFSAATSVPATLNSNSINVTHRSTVAQPTYDGTNSAVSLGSNTNGGNPIGTEYRVEYDFHQGSSYQIVINAYGIYNVGQPNLRINIANSTGTSSQCNGPQTIDPTLTGNLIMNNIIANGIFRDYTYNYSPMAAALPYLTVSNVPNPSSGSQTILIRKITIVETPPATSFSLSPSSASKICGSVLSQTFTANATYIPPGATVSYLWNLGSSGNGWLYNGSAAPQTITTSGNTLSLTADACGTTPSNVSATATVNGTNYSAGTVTVSSPALSISGSPYICTNGSATFSIANLDCSPTVTWSVSPSGIVNIASPNSPQTSISYISNGDATITASFSSPCGNGTLTYAVTSGSPAPIGTSNYISNYGSGSVSSISSQYVILGTNHGQPGDNDVAYNYNINDSRFTSINWIPVSAPSGTNYQVANGGVTLYTYVTYAGTNGSKAITMNLQASGPCGTYSQNITSTAARISGWGGYSMIVAPNPAKGSTKVSLAPDATKAKSNSVQQNSTTKAPLIRMILLINQVGKTVRTFEYKAGVSTADISLANIPPGLYKLSISDGLNWTSQQIIVQ